MKGASFIQGAGWVTPLGNGLDEAWSRLVAGESGAVKLLDHGGRSYPYMPVAPKQVEAMGKNPRLRRSSAISYFAATAGLSALANAGIEMNTGGSGKLAVILAISSGGVAYTRRFYDMIVEKGASAASPLLFPETVYNAPASHLAALMGIDGMSYTLVGDSSVGISAIKFAEQLLATTKIDHCLVVGAEEVDWVLCEAYREWRLATTEQAVSLYARRPGGALLGEGAAAVVIGRMGKIRVEFVHDGIPFFNKSGAGDALRRVFLDIERETGVPDLIIGAANGSVMDNAEAPALREAYPATPVYCPKGAMGEALGASGLMQTVVAVLALDKSEIPPSLGCESARNGLEVVAEHRFGTKIRKVLVSSLGFNFQASGLVLR